MGYQILKLTKGKTTDFSMDGTFHAVIDGTAVCGKRSGKAGHWNDCPGFHVNCKACLEKLQGDYKDHIRYLLEAEKNSQVSLMWGRSGEVIWVSTYGYRHMEHSAISSALLQLGCRYDFSDEHGLEDFCSSNGRTTSYFREAK